MSAGDRVLFLRLEGPLQSWGDDAQWSVRPTRREPTKSGVLGMIAAAHGWGLNAEGDQRVADLAAAVRLGVRADREGTVIRDYHTVVGGVLNAQGRIKVTGTTREVETVVSERYYLADACFLAALAGPEDMLHQIREALRHPVWPIFLGRRSCPPAVPVWPPLPGMEALWEGDDLAAALASVPWLCPRDGESAPCALRAVVELAPGEERDGPIYTRRDVPISFSGRRFATRRVCETTVKLPKEAT